MEISHRAMYVNPNTGNVTSNLKNVRFDKQKYGQSGMRLLNNYTIDFTLPNVYADSTRIDKENNSADFGKGASLQTDGGYILTLREDGFFEISGGNGNDRDWQKAWDISTTLSTYIDVASGRKMMVHYNERERKAMLAATKRLFDYLGLDYSKDFTINGMKFSWNEEHTEILSQSFLDALDAWNLEREKNRTYEFADDITKREIEHKADYFLQSAPEEIRKMFMETIEETGANPFAMGYGNVISQLAMEQDFATGGNDQLFGDTLESSIEAVNKILERIDNPLGKVTEDKQIGIQKEKEFYLAFLSKLNAL